MPSVACQEARVRGAGQTYSVLTFLMVSSDGPVGGLAAVSIITCSFSTASS